MESSKNEAFNALNADRSEKADQMHQAFLELGVDFATGVPCGVLRHIIRNFNDDEKIFHMLANRESEAIGLAAGAYFAGKTPVVYMQNSGFFAASNDIASLLIPYEMPIFFVVSYRGCEGEDAIQHLTTGRATKALIRSLGLPFMIFGGQDIATLVRSTFKEMRENSLPAILLLKRGWQQ